jgi:DNA-binding transcriptional MocR family regulator
VLLAALAAQLPGWDVRVPAGGLVLWCRLPSRSSSALVSAAEVRGLLLAAGPRFGTGHAFENRLRLPYTQPADVLETGVTMLAAVSDELPAARWVPPGQQLVV